MSGVGSSQDDSGGPSGGQWILYREKKYFCRPFITCPFGNQTSSSVDYDAHLIRAAHSLALHQSYAGYKQVMSSLDKKYAHASRLGTSKKALTCEDLLDELGMSPIVVIPHLHDVLFWIQGKCDHGWETQESCQMRIKQASVQTVEHLFV